MVEDKLFEAIKEMQKGIDINKADDFDLGWFFALERLKNKIEEMKE